MEDFEIAKNVKCCISEQPLDEPLSIVFSDCIASWPHPSVSNLCNEQEPARAVAFVHSNYMKFDQYGQPCGLVLPLVHVVEFRGEEVIYHPVNSLPCVNP